MCVVVRRNICGPISDSNRPMPTPTNKSEAKPDNPDARWRWILLAPHYWPTWLALGIFRLVEPLPYPFLMALGRAVGAIARRLPTHFVKVARANLRLCMPSLSDAEREKLIDEHFASLGMGLI